MLPLLDRITLIELSDGMQAKRLYDELVLFVRSLNSVSLLPSWYIKTTCVELTQMSRRTYAPPPTLRPLYEFAQEHLSPPHVTMDTPSGFAFRPEGGELVVRWRGARIHIRLDPTGYSFEIPRRTVARYHSREFGTLQEPGLGGRTFNVEESARWAGTAVLEYETPTLDDALALLQCVFAIIYETETMRSGQW